MTVLQKYVNILKCDTLFVISCHVKQMIMLRSLPQDPFILLSFINTKLRDNYKSLDQLCDDLEAGKNELIARLASVGYVYDPTQNKFI